MGIVLIVAGAVLLIWGIIMVSSKQGVLEQAQSQPQVVIEERHIHDTVTVQSATAGEEQHVVAPTQAAADNSDVRDDSKAKGDAFENFVVNLLADWRLKLLDRTQDAVSTAGVVAESCKNPDLHVQQKRGESNIDYYLECKYRSRWYNGEITFEGWQLDRYRQFQRDNRRKVIIALGVGGTASAPATFMLVPLDSIRGNSVKQVKTEFIVSPTSSALVEYMNDYFTTVFRKAKKK